MTKMNFNSHKSWHVHSKGNRDRLEKVEQKADEKDSANLNKKRDRDREKDFEDTKKLAEKFNSFHGQRQMGFMYEPPPGMSKDEKETRPEDLIPDLPENKEAREFLKSAPSKGLWMPLGKEVKVMQCWRCKQYGHRTGDKECPLAQAGNVKAESERQAREDPMSIYLQEKKDKEEQKEEKKKQKIERLDHLKKLLAKAEKRHMKKKLKRKLKKKEEEKRKAKKRKHNKGDSSESSSSTESSDSDSSSSGSESESRKSGLDSPRQ